MKNILIISSSPRKNGNSQILCKQFKKRCRSKRASGENRTYHGEEYRIAGKIYAANVMDAGLVKNQSVFQKAYDMGYSI